MKKYRSCIFILLCFWSINCESQSLEFIIDGVHNNPGEKSIITKYSNPAYLQSQGFNSISPHWHICCAITYDNFSNKLIPENTNERNWIELNAKRIDSNLRICKNTGIQVFPFADFLIFPKKIWQKYGDSMCALNLSIKKTGLYKPDIKRKYTQLLLRAQIAGIFDRFPLLDGIIIRFGETYLDDTPFHLGGSPVTNPEEQIIFINILRDEICVKRNKKLFYRTWDFGNAFHNNPDYYLKVTNSIEPHPNLIFSIKYQQGDFLRMTPFNPCLGIGKHQQIIESQSQMEVYGKGAHPYYSALGVINGWPETKYEIDWSEASFTGKINDYKNPRGIKDILKTGLICGVNTWSRGGGWQGPYIESEIWIDLNTYVVSHWAQHTSLSEEDLFNEFAKQKGFEGINLDLFRQIAILSIEAVRKGQCNSYTKNQLWWSRDEYFSVSDNQEVINSIITKGLTEKVLAEKAESVAIWKQIESLAKQISIEDTALQNAIRVSCIYGRIKYELIEKMWQLMLIDAESNKLNSEKENVKKIIKQYDELWSEWKALRKSSPYCATLYTEMGFRNQNKGSIGELVNKLRRL